jgi:hypothetical protein
LSGEKICHHFQVKILFTRKVTNHSSLIVIEIF